MMVAAHDGRSPVILRGADKLTELSPDQKARVGYYRDLGMAFAGVAGN